MDRGVRVEQPVPRLKMATKIQWCRSVIGSVGCRIIKGLPDGAQWGQVKAELRKYLGKDNPKSAA